MARRVLITGASGFLGSYLLQNIPPDAKVLAQYHSTLPISAPHPNIQTIQLNFENPDLRALQRFSPDVIIHAGAWTRIDECEQNPAQSERINVDFTIALCRLAKDMDARMIFLSTDQVFDGNNPPYSETAPTNPLNVYARHKLAAEKAVLNTVPDAVVARAALIYGKALHQKPTFTEIMYLNLKNERPVNVFVDEYRTPVLVQNLTDAVWELTENHFRGVIHLGGSERVTRYQMGEKMCDLFGLDKSLLVPVEMAALSLPAKRAADLSFDIALAKSVLETTFDDVTTGLSKSFSA
jgi:dTDP-4-dehydrorhamnose reductase